ncbi:MAG: alpha/beta hydrolase [Elainellaceae cyanobacterium]
MPIPSLQSQPHFSHALHGMVGRTLRRICVAIAFSTGLSISLSAGISAPARAAESVVLKYHGFQRSVAVEDLTLLAETGEVSSELRPYIRLSGYPAAEMREMLNQDVSVNPVLLSRVLNNPAGDAVLDRASKAVHTRSRRGDRQALRGALVVSASDDEEITPIELIQNYPTEEMYVDVVEFQRAYQDISELVELQRRVGDWIERVL